MKRRNFLKSCLGVACVPVLSVFKNKAVDKEIEIYVPCNEKTNRPGVIKYRDTIKVKYTGKSKALPGQLMMWKEDGTVCKAIEFAGVAK